MRDLLIFLGVVAALLLGIGALTWWMVVKAMAKAVSSADPFAWEPDSE